MIVDDIASDQRNALVGGPFGSNLVSKDYVDSGIPVIRGQNLGTGRWVAGEFAFVTKEKAESLSANLARPGDLVFTQRGTLGQVAIIPSEPYNLYLISQSQMKLTADSSKANALYLYYEFTSPRQQAYIDTNAIRVGVPHTNLGILRNTPLSLPDPEEQKRIAHILGTLDDKIELNRRMNRTLEEMAQAIFKSWFVDFEPVKAKAAAKAAGANQEEVERAAMTAIAGKTEAELDQLPEPRQQSLAQTAALFSDGFQDSELGEIPEGWSIAGFNQLATLDTTSVKPFEAPNKVWEHYSIPSFDSSHLPAYEVGESIKSNKYAVKSGAILSSKLNPQFPRTWWPHLFDRESAICSTEFMQFVAVDVSEQAFIYGLITSASFQAGIAERVTGSTGSRQRAQPNQIATMAVVDPGVELRQEFVRLALPTYGKSNANLAESRTLAELRDALLPKLLSGDIELPDLERSTD